MAFTSLSDDLVPGDTNQSSDVFVRDLAGGMTVRVSDGAAGVEGNGDSESPSLSFDGRVVAFHSSSSNLVPGDTNKKFDVFVHDRKTGMTQRVSVGAGNVQGDEDALFPSLSSDGQRVVFDARSTTLVPLPVNSANGGSATAHDPPDLGLESFEGLCNVYVRDLAQGDTEVASVSAAGSRRIGDSLAGRISGDGMHVAFTSSASLVPGDTNGRSDVFVVEVP